MISVLLPVRDGERFLAASIDSVLAQTWRDFELLVLDDGSTDGTAAIAASYAARDDRVRVIRLSGGGISRALNAGLEDARRPWIARMDADDIAYPDRLAVQLEAALREPAVVLWGAWAHGIDERGSEVLSIVRAGPTDAAEFRHLRDRRRPVQVLHPTAFFPRRVALGVGRYDPRFDGAEDLELWNRMAEHGEVRTIPRALLAYRVHGRSAGADRFQHARWVARFVEARLRGEIDDVGDAFERFRSREAARPWVRRALTELGDRSRWRYRRAGLEVASGRRARGLWSLGLAATVNPSYVVPRLWRQAVAPRLGLGPAGLAGVPPAALQRRTG
jgi:glycosyltransferase involved in cell wall biosynthesis